MEGVYIRRHTDKLGLIDQPIRCGADFALRDEFVERRSGNAELARGVGFGEAGHGP
jgi:hypothetical protein